MNIIIFGLLIFACAIAPCVASDDKGVEKSAPNLCGVATQGGMLYGEAAGWDVFYGAQKISNKDVFVIGLDRDAPASLKLKFCQSENCQTYSYKIAAREYLEQKINVDDKFVSYPPDIEKRINAESAKIKSARALAADDEALYFLEFKLPENLKQYRVSGVFGSRRVFNNAPKSPHKGVDFAAPAGTPVYPIADGKIILAEEHYMNGKIILISHGHGIVSAYLHLSQIDAKAGDVVSKSRMIGKVGSTGRSSGPHLHLGLYWKQTAIDPGLFVLEGK
jgi:murein DD-endopeptidase MepM/ murein hydrolase activator NlpD